MDIIRFFGLNNVNFGPESVLMTRQDPDSIKTNADPHHGYSAISELLEPMFSVQTWMVETEEKVSSGFDWNLC